MDEGVQHEARGMKSVTTMGFERRWHRWFGADWVGEKGD